MKMTIRFIVFIFTITFSWLSLAADDKCINEKITQSKRTEPFSREGEVRCEGAGFSGNGNSNNANVSFSAAPNYQIVGNILIEDLSNNRGNYGSAEYIKDTTGRVTGVTVPISCASPNQTFGSGAWMKIRISGTVESFPTEEELNNIRQSCPDNIVDTPSPTPEASK